MYLDTSILIKLLVPEPDSGQFQELLRGALLSTSELAMTEVWSALLSKERIRQITARHRAAAWSVFNERILTQEIQIHPLGSVTLKKANGILEICHPKVPLRTLDAIHLAACDLSQDFPLCTTDARMREAAKVLKIPVVPEQ
jgi:predicted nucleic acid-binding protein